MTSQHPLYQLITNNTFIPNLNHYPGLDDDLAKCYEKYVLVNLEESISISQATSDQNSAQWLLERSKRICICKAYKVYSVHLH